MVLGTSVRVPILEGQTDLKIPPGTQAGTKFRLKSKGIKNIKGFGQGDLYVVVNVEIPTTISRDEKDYFQKISKIRNDNDRLSNTLNTLGS